MILTEYDAKKQRQLDLRDAHETGLEEGLSLGRTQGLEQGRVNSLRIFLLNGGTKEQAKQLLNATDEELSALNIEKISSH